MGLTAPSFPRTAYRDQGKITRKAVKRSKRNTGDLLLAGLSACDSSDIWAAPESTSVEQPFVVSGGNMSNVYDTNGNLINEPQHGQGSSRYKDEDSTVIDWFDTHPRQVEVPVLTEETIIPFVEKNFPGVIVPAPIQEIPVLALTGIPVTKFVVESPVVEPVENDQVFKSLKAGFDAVLADMVKHPIAVEPAVDSVVEPAVQTFPEALVEQAIVNEAASNDPGMSQV
jgi:hypothetical protein